MNAVGRPTWIEYFMDIADLVAKRSTCLRRQVGAVAVKDKRILATGYNGVPSGIPHCLDVGCLREQEGIPSGERHELCRGIHAEQNVIIQAAHSGVAIRGRTVLHQPALPYLFQDADQCRDSGNILSARVRGPPL